MKLYKILIVDDEIGNIKSIVNCFIESDEQYVLYQALNAELAFKIAIAEQPDLIITDWEMPGMNGIELIKKLKQNELTSDIPAIMCTGVMVNSENLHTALMSGAVDYIRKPIDKLELIARVKSMLEISDSRKIIKARLDEIESHNKLFFALIESVPHPYVYYNLEGVIMGCNHLFEDLMGHRGQNLVGKTVYDFMDDEKTGLCLELDIKLKNDKLNLNYEFKFGGRCFVCTKSLFIDSHGKSEGIMSVLTDLTELKQVHNEVLENKKRELTSSALRLIQMSELNNSLVADLLKMNAFTNKKGGEIIRKATNKFNLSTGENFWKEFESRFENVYESFYEKLNNSSPTLTAGEKKLCALLRLNLTSKDIAAITFQNPQSIDMSRYRLRKKMNLSPNENLVDYFLNL